MRLLSRPHFPSCFLYWLTLEAKMSTSRFTVFSPQGQVNRLRRHCIRCFETVFFLHDLHSVLELVGPINLGDFFFFGSPCLEPISDGERFVEIPQEVPKLVAGPLRRVQTVK